MADFLVGLGQFAALLFLAWGMCLCVTEQNSAGGKAGRQHRLPYGASDQEPPHIADAGEQRPV